MKGKGISRRFVFALAGFGHALRSERSFRTQAVAAVVAALVTALLRPGWLWAGLMAVAIALVLALELVNTALEHVLDGLHPKQAQFVGIAKDCAAAAVLVAALLAVALFLFMLMDVALP